MTQATPERELERLLEQALDLAPDVRDAYLRRACGDNLALRTRVAKLIALADGDDGFLDRSPLRAATTPPVESPAQAIGQEFGAYRIVRLLGVGGMGEVYLAERIAGGFQQQVALKLVRRDVASAPQRFDEERRILAALEHPGIARLYDGGVSADGRPYMAMEYVQGSDLLASCTQRGANLAQRLALFLQVCDAVSYAHAHLVVHRDLKPANIFVTADGRTKLLDFGIARLLKADGLGEALHTAHFSAAYAAPEQLSGGAITTATDVYALGVTLFQLLTARLPWSGSELPMAAAMQRLIEDAAPRPSSLDAPDAPVPARLLRGDLDAIIGKALRREPRDRYPDARALAHDLRRFLQHEPVQARSGAQIYVLRRFVRRHWLALSAAAAIFVVLVAGIAGTAWQAQRATREATLANATRDFLIGVFRASDPRIAQDLPRDQITARQLLDAGAAQIERDFSAQPELQIELLGLTADIYENLGDDERYEALQQRRMALANAHYGPAHPIVLDGLVSAAEAAIYRQDYAGATRGLAEVDAQLDGSALDRSVVRARWWLVQWELLHAEHASEAALEHAVDQAIALYQQFAPQSNDYAYVLGLKAINLGRSEQHVEARRYFERALTVLESAPDRSDADLQTLLGNSARNLEKLGEFAAAERTHVRAEELARKTGGERYPAYWLARAYHARLLHLQGERERAQALFAQMLLVIPPEWKSTNDDAWARGEYAVCLAAEGRAQDAVPILEATLRKYAKRSQGSSLAVWRLDLGDAYDRAGRADEARVTLKAALDEVMGAAQPDPGRMQTFRERWARFLLDHSTPGDADFLEAEATLQAVVAQAAGAASVELALAQSGLARVALAQGDTSQARILSETAQATLAQVQALHDVRLQPQVWLIHSAVLLQQGDREGAQRWAQRALADSRRYDDPASPAIAQAELAVRAAAPK